MDDLRDLVGAYVLSALDDEEAAVFEAYVADRPELKREVKSLQEAGVVLGEAVTSMPPERLRSAVLDAIADVPQEAVGNVVPLRPPRWNRMVMAVAAVIVLLLGVAVGSQLVGGDSRIDEVLAAPDVQVLDLVVEGLPGKFAYSFSEQAGVLTANRIPTVTAAETYQLWLIGDGGPESAGVFVPEANGSVEVLVTGKVSQGVLLGLTVEPSGGSDQPTGDILFAVPLG